MAAPTPASPLDARLLATLERAFGERAGADQRIDRAELQAALGLRSEYLAGRVLAAFDRDGDGFISRHEFVEGVRALVFGTDREKLGFVFRVHDHDGDGALSRDEVLRMITLSLAESDTRRATQSPEQLTRALFAMADRDRDGRISLDELEAVVQRRPELLRQMTHTEAAWVVPNEELVAWLDEPRAPGRGRLARWLDSAWQPGLLLALWLGANVAVFGWSLYSTLAPDPRVQLGRALGKCIGLNAAMVLVPVMRRLLTRVRASWLGRVVPVDDALGVHKVLGHAIFALSLAHGGALLAAFLAGHGAQPVTQLLWTERGLTGALLIALLAILWLFALGPVRRSRRFELFYFTHLLYVPWLALAIAHAPSMLVFAGLPLAAFGLEQALRLRRRGPRVTVTASEALRSGVVRLELQRPPGLSFGAGDYVFLRIPAIARREWHPFTISIAPEADALTFHVRSLGNWTAALRRAVEARAPGDPPMHAFVDGPYGSPSAPIFRSRFAVLIGAGIGVTPFASVLESLVLRGNRPGDDSSRLEKAHFFWLNRDQYSFEWFAQLLSRLERDDRKGLLQIHLCMTAGRIAATSLGLELAREVLRAAGRSDIVTGLRTKTHMGQPDWEAWLGAIAHEHAPAPVDVYFCGPPGLGATLRPLCARLRMPFHEERF